MNLTTYIYLVPRLRMRGAIFYKRRSSCLCVELSKPCKYRPRKCLSPHAYSRHFDRDPSGRKRLGPMLPTVGLTPVPLTDSMSLPVFNASARDITVP